MVAEEEGIQRQRGDCQRDTEEMLALAAKYCFESQGSLDVLDLFEPRYKANGRLKDVVIALPRWTSDSPCPDGSMAKPSWRRFSLEQDPVERSHSARTRHLRLSLGSTG